MKKTLIVETPGNVIHEISVIIENGLRLRRKLLGEKITYDIFPASFYVSPTMAPEVKADIMARIADYGDIFIVCKWNSKRETIVVHIFEKEMKERIARAIKGALEALIGKVEEKDEAVIEVNV